MYLPFFFISKSSEQQKTNRDIYTTPPGNVGLKQKQKLNMERLVGNRENYQNHATLPSPPFLSLSVSSLTPFLLKHYTFTNTFKWCNLQHPQTYLEACTFFFSVILHFFPDTSTIAPTFPLNHRPSPALFSRGRQHSHTIPRISTLSPFQ